MHRSCLFLFALLCSAVCPLRGFAQAQPPAPPTATAAPPPAPVLAKPQTPEEFFARARQLSDLEAAGVPFHLKATYIATGDAEFTGNGTYEEWWQSKNTWRKDASLGTFHYSVMMLNGKAQRPIQTGEYVPLRLRQAMTSALLQIAPDKGSGGTWKISQQKLNQVALAELSSQIACPRPMQG